MGPNDLEGYGVTPPQLTRGNSMFLDTPQSAFFYAKEDSPRNSFRPEKKYVLITFRISVTLTLSQKFWVFVLKQTMVIYHFYCCTVAVGFVL